MKILLSTILFFVIVQASSQVDNFEKNVAINKELKEKYEAELEDMPNSAIPHWNHANELSKVMFGASNNAANFYIKALRIDSTNAEIYKDFGNFLLKNNDRQNAYFCFERGKKINPSDEYFTQKLNEIEELALKKKKYWELHSLPVRDKSIEEIPEMSFEEMADYKKLFKLTNKGDFEFAKLAAKFKSNPNSLNAKECFFLLIGQVQQEYYKPYNYEDEKQLQSLTQMGKIDEALEYSENLLEIEPTNILALRELLYCYRVKENELKITETENRLKKLFSGFLYSGDGSCDRPIVTLSVQEEYPISIYLGYSPVKVVKNQSLCNGLFIDNMLMNNEGIEEYLYFNYEPIFIGIRNE